MENQGEIKSKLSNPAKILMGYMKATGITDAKTIATNLDIPLRTVQRLKLECATCANDAISGASDDAKDAKHARYGAPNTPDMAFSAQEPSCAHATKESPTEISYSREVQQQQPRAEQIHQAVMAAAGDALNPVSIGLNIVSDVIGWMNQGADLELDIVPTIAALSKGKRHTVNSWRFYASAVSNATNARKRGLPPPIEAASKVVHFRPTDTSGRPLRSTSEVLAMIAAEDAAHAAR